VRKREFRTADSYAAEHITRRMLPDFLRSKGFRDIRDIHNSIGKAESQTIDAIFPSNERVRMRVKLCWRRRGKPRENTYSAVQLLARIQDGKWEGSIAKRVEKAQSDAVTHFLLVQRGDGSEIAFAALIPASELLPIWCAQRDISEQLIEEGMLGRRRKNHAMNGSSPTLWLQDDNAPDVAAALWDHAGVRDLAKMEGRGEKKSRDTRDDTFDDLRGIDYSLIGSDGAEAIIVHRSEVKRDPRVRAAVLERAAGKCERCGTFRGYLGFLDVHHVLGVEKSDRVWNCVAVCPNCHREAHAAPNCREINEELLRLAMSVKEAPVLKLVTEAGEGMV
jgi:5-methylcytosine-specific restriction protein A